MNEPMTKQEMLDILKEIITPIDFDKLIAEGVIKKVGAWYTILKPKELPHHAWKQAFAMEISPKGSLKLKFKKATKRTEALYKKIAGEANTD